jgi:hypothetical protein
VGHAFSSDAGKRVAIVIFPGPALAGFLRQRLGIWPCWLITSDRVSGKDNWVLAAAATGRGGRGASMMITFTPVGSASVGSADANDPLNLRAISSALSLASLSGTIRLSLTLPCVGKTLSSLRSAVVLNVFQ